MPLIYGGTTVNRLIYNGTACQKGIYNGTTVFVSEKVLYTGSTGEADYFTSVPKSSYDWGSGYTVYWMDGWPYIVNSGDGSGGHSVMAENQWGNYSQCGRLFTPGKIDFSGFSYLNFSAAGSGNSYYVQAMGFATGSRGVWTNRVTKSGDWSGTVSVALNGATSGYIGFSVEGAVYTASATLRVYKIWLS